MAYTVMNREKNGAKYTTISINHKEYAGIAAIESSRVILPGDFQISIIEGRYKWPDEMEFHIYSKIPSKKRFEKRVLESALKYDVLALSVTLDEIIPALRLVNSELLKRGFNPILEKDLNNPLLKVGCGCDKQ